MSRRLRATAVTLFAAFASGGAVAQNVCVDCKDPERNYRCTIKDSERAQQIRGGNRAIEFLCISEIARLGGHQSCRVSTGFVGPCIGHHHEIDLARPSAAEVVVGRPPPTDGGA